MKIKSLAILSATLLFSVAPSYAELLTMTFTGTASGTDSAGYFGSTGGSLQSVDFTSTYVFDSAGGITYGGAGNFVTGDAVSASLAIDGTTFNFPIGSNPQLTLLAGQDILLSGSAGGVDAFLKTASGATFKNYLYSTDFPVISDFSTPFSYHVTTVTPLNRAGQFDIGGDNLSLNATNVALTIGAVGAVPEPSTWAMLLLGFCGLGFMACGRKDGALRAA